MFKRFTFVLIITSFVMNAQDLPYHQIPDYPADYSAGNMVSRMVDGLGYRYYWATKDLTEKDLAYKPSEDGRTSLETLKHIYGLSLTVLRTAQNEVNISTKGHSDYSFEELRKLTLDNLKLASELYSKIEDFDKIPLVFNRNGNTSEFPFWHVLNGPLADAIYHTGQIVMLRRASGNPIQNGVNVFLGKTNE